MIVGLIKRNDLLMTLSILRSFCSMPIALTPIINHFAEQIPCKGYRKCFASLVHKQLTNFLFQFHSCIHSMFDVL